MPFGHTLLSTLCFLPESEEKLKEGRIGISLDEKGGQYRNWMEAQAQPCLAVR